MNKELEDALGNLTQQAYNSADNEKQLQKDKEHYELIKKELKKYEELKIFIYKEKEKIDKQIKELDPDYNEPIADCEECEMWSRLFSKQELLEEIIKEVLK